MVVELTIRAESSVGGVVSVRTVRRALVLVVVAVGLLSVTLKSFPSQLAGAEATLRIGLVAPGIAVPFVFHWIWAAPAPMTLNWNGCPSVTVRSFGPCVIRTAPVE